MLLKCYKFKLRNRTQRTKKGIWTMSRFDLHSKLGLVSDSESLIFKLAILWVRGWLVHVLAICFIFLFPINSSIQIDVNNIFAFKNKICTVWTSNSFRRGIRGYLKNKILLVWNQNYASNLLSLSRFDAALSINVVTSLSLIGKHTKRQERKGVKNLFLIKSTTFPNGQNAEPWLYF